MKELKSEPPKSSLRTPRPPKERKSPHNARSDLIILRLGVAVAPELGRLAQQTASEPRPVPLPLVRDHLDLQASAPGAAASCLRGADARVDEVSDVALEAAAEVFVERRAAGEDDVLVQASTDVDGG